MEFDPKAYGEEVAAILALDGNGARLMPLAGGACSSEEACRTLRECDAGRLFPGARAPQAALSGLFLYFSCLDEAHAAAQNVGTPEGSYWHAIMHRQEPDAGNAGYWFARVGQHPVFDALHETAVNLAAAHPGVWMSMPAAWDPYEFVEFCERARREPGTPAEALAREIQLAEWQLLFDYCARRS